MLSIDFFVEIPNYFKFSSWMELNREGGLENNGGLEKWGEIEKGHGWEREGGLYNKCLL